jgi:hypothetical protein
LTGISIQIHREMFLWKKNFVLQFFWQREFFIEGYLQSSVTYSRGMKMDSLSSLYSALNSKDWEAFSYFRRKNNTYKKEESASSVKLSLFFVE